MYSQNVKEEPYPLYKNELTTKKEEIDGIFSDAIEKAKVSFLVPCFLENVDKVRERLKGTEYQNCALALQKYKKNNYAKLKKYIENSWPHLDSELIKLIDLFQDNFKLVKYFPDWLEDLNNRDQTLLVEMVLIKETAKQRFGTTVVQHLEDEKALSSIYHENEKVERGVRTMNRLMGKNRTSVLWKLAARGTILATMDEEINEEIRKNEEILRIERNIAGHRLDPRQFLARERAAEEDLQNAKMKCEKAAQICLRDEYQARAERNKWELQLKAVIRKYDQTISDKFKENLKITERFEQMQEEHELFVKTVFERAEKVYIDIVRAKELEEERKFQAKIEEFRRNRAARVIQLAYREYLREHNPDLLPKVKKPKGKKGK